MYLQKQHTDHRCENDAKLEEQWAETAHKYATIFEKLIMGVPPEKHATFRFTPHDDKLYEKFRKSFPRLKVEVLNLDDLKSGQAKVEWYNFLETNGHLVNDYNMGTILRVDSQKPFGPTNSTITPRLQFYMIELARFREGCNARFRQLMLEQKQKEAQNQAEIQAENKAELEDVGQKPTDGEAAKLLDKIAKNLDK